MKEKTPENISEARGILYNMLVMDDETMKARIWFEIARCNSLLGNFSEAVTYLAKTISTGNYDTKFIEETPDFDPIRQTEAFSTLISVAKNRSTLPTGFLQYFLSTLCCAVARREDGDWMETIKYPIREGEKAAGKRKN